MKTFFYCLCMAALLNACNTSRNHTDPALETSITGINWYLSKIYLPSSNMDISNRKSFIKFDAEKHSTGGNGGCNSFGSSYSLKGNVIAFKGVYSTKMYCEEFQKQEDAFFKQLELADKIELKDSKLYLYRSEAVLLEFVK